MLLNLQRLLYNLITFELRTKKNKTPTQAMIQFKVKKLKSPKTGTLFYFPSIVQSGTLTLSEVASRIAKRSTMHTADIKAVLSALEQTVGDALTSGHSVR